MRILCVPQRAYSAWPGSWLIVGPLCLRDHALIWGGNQLALTAKWYRHVDALSPGFSYVLPIAVLVMLYFQLNINLTLG